MAWIINSIGGSYRLSTPSMTELAIIGGTGLTELADFQVLETREIDTDYGQPSAALTLGEFAGQRLWFLPRHGSGSPIPPHRVNYRANLKALEQLGVKRVIAVNAVGGIREDLPPGSVCLPDQLIDYSWGRAQSFFDSADDEPCYAEFAEPYSQALRQALMAAAHKAGAGLVSDGVYAVTQGPRLETAAEINRLERDGCTIVGMTGMPEAGLARELALEYACLAVSVNWAAGRGPNPQAAIHSEIEQWLTTGMQRAVTIISAYCR